MELLTFILYYTWGDRGVAKLLLLCGLLLFCYRKYKAWKISRRYKAVEGKVILLTGASSGLGEACARVFHAAGARLILCSRNTQQLDRIQFQLTNEVQSSDKVIRFPPKVIQLDLEDGKSIPSKAQQAQDVYGHIDVLINNAGISSRGNAIETDIKVDRRIMEVNFFGPVMLTKSLLPHMIERKNGHIVVISSVQGKLGLPLRTSYSASKHALQGYFDSLRVELLGHNIQLTVISPGYINTKLSANALTADGSKHQVTDATTKSGASPVKMADTVLEAVIYKRREVVTCSLSTKVALWLHSWCPSLLDHILKRRAGV